MSDDTTVLRRLPEGLTSARIVGGIAVAVTVIALVTGAALVGRADGPFEDAGERIQAFYAESDVDGMLRAFPDGSVPAEQADATRSALGRILVPGVEIVEVSEPVDVAGVPVVRVVTGDRISWCVRPDGGVLPQCRVGEVEIEASGDPRFTADIAQVDLPLDGQPQMALGLTLVGDEAVTLEGLALVDAAGDPVPARLAQVALVRGGQGEPADPEAPTVEPGTQLFLGWLLDVDPSDLDLRLTWDGGSLDLDLHRTRWFVR